MKKILIWLLLFSVVIFSEEIDLLKQIDDSKYEENTVNFFLDTIRKKNNLLVINILDMEKNRQLRQRNAVEGAYGPVIEPRQIRIQLTVNSRNRQGYTPIIVAIESGNNEMLSELLKRGASARHHDPTTYHAPDRFNGFPLAPTNECLKSRDRDTQSSAGERAGLRARSKTPYRLHNPRK